MIKDLELLRDLTPLFEKKIVIWGMGFKGKKHLKEITQMGAGKKGIYLCDSKADTADTTGEYIIELPERIREQFKETDLSDVLILVTVDSIDAQEEILERIWELYGDKVDVCTEYAVEWGIYFCLKCSKVEEAWKVDEENVHKKRIAERKAMWGVRNIEKPLKYLAYLPMYNDQAILVYQPGKVGSSTVFHTLETLGYYVLHSHLLKFAEKDKGELCQLLNLKSTKIISMIREPLARQQSCMWQNVADFQRYSEDADFKEVEEYYFSEGCENEEFEWFNREMKEVLQIDVFAHPFDKEKGYTIIKEGNIELLLMTMEKLNDLEEVIGDFVGIKDFKLMNSNEGSKKAYRYAYKQFKETFQLPQELIDRTFRENEYMKHFYTEEQLETFRKKYC